MGNRGEGAEFKKGGNRLGVSDALGKAFSCGGKFECSRVKESSAEGLRAKGLSEKSETPCNLGGGAIEKREGLLEAGILGGCKGSDGGMGGWEGQDLGFCFVEDDANRRTKALEGFDEDGEVIIWEEGKSIVEVCVGGALRAAAVVTALMGCASGLCPFL